MMAGRCGQGPLPDQSRENQNGVCQVKIVIAGPQGDLIRQMVEKERHAVVAHTPSLKRLVHLLLQYTPHCVFIICRDQDQQKLTEIAEIFPTIRFVLIDEHDAKDTTRRVRQALKQGRINVPWRTEKPEGRNVLIDSEYEPYAADGKLKRPVMSETWDNDAAGQLLRLSWMIRVARQQLERANRYREAYTALGGFEWQEIAYRLVHGSFKASAYARDQIARYVSYIVHFVPSADLDGLISPVDEPAHLRFVHYHPPLEAHYALFCLGLFGFNGSLSKPLYRILDWRFRGQSDDELMADSITMNGLAISVLVICYSQATTIDFLLAPDVLRKLNDRRPRNLHRSLQTFCDFWELRHAMDDNRMLAAAIDDARANPLEVLPPELIIPSFGEFHRAINAQTTTTQEP
jgi:hypothetical protein